MIPAQEAESDLRSAYCAAAITYILTQGGKSDFLPHVGYSVPKLLTYIDSCRSYAGGFGDPSNFEAHSGMTYCAVASLKLLKSFEITDQRDLVEFLVLR